MHHLVYTSTANFPLTENDLSQLLGRWRAHNNRLGITGVLLYSEGNILQVLEGKAEVLHTMFTTIAADVRHRSVIKLADGPARGRVFGDWSMQFRAVDTTDFVRFVQQMNLAADHASRLAPLLENFMVEEKP